MKKSATDFARKNSSSNGHHGNGFENNGAHVEPSLRARLKYGARLKRVARLASQFDTSFSLTSKSRFGSRGLVESID
jgi:hypothetical protein